MTTALGILAKCGIKECSSWGEVWSAVDTLIPFTAESITKQAELIEDMVLEGTAGKRAPNRGLIKVPGTLDFELDFYNCGKLLEMAMGSESSGVYDLVDDLDKIFRMEFDKQVSRWRYDGVMVDSLQLTGEKGQVIKGQVALVCRDLSRSSSAFPSLSFSNRSKVIYTESSTNSRIRIGDLVDALGSGEEIGWESFTLRLERNLKTDDATNQQRQILQPKINDFRKVTLSIKAPRYTADTIPDWKDNATDLQCDLYFTDGTKKCHIEIPQLQIARGFDCNIAGPQIIPLEGEADCFINTGNSNMSAITKEFRITIANV